LSFWQHHHPHLLEASPLSLSISTSYS
jgi:hypothetical protein